jgi:hypothetical protein
MLRVVEVSRSWWGVRVVGVGVVFALTLGCARPGVERIVGPDGSPMLHVHCGKDQGQCFAMAGNECPYGYEIRPVFEADAGNFLVRCRMPAALAPTPALPAPSYQAVAPAPPQGWPPASEPARPAEPWPPPQAAAPVPASPSSAPGPVDATRPMPKAFEDLGY